MTDSVIFKSTFYQFVSRVATATITLIITIAIARIFGGLGYGEFTKVTAFVAFFYLLADAGLNALYLQKDQDNRYFRDLFWTRVMLGIALVFLVSAVTLFLPYDPRTKIGFSVEVRLGIILYALTILQQAIIYTAGAVFQKKQQFNFSMVANISGSLVSLFCVAIFLLFAKSLLSVLLAFVVGWSVTAFLSLLWAKQKLLPFSFHWSFIRALLKESTPLSAMLLINLVYFRADIFLLSFLRPATDVGIYGLSYKFFDFLIAIPTFLSNSLYPLLLHHVNNRQVFYYVISKYFIVFLALSVLIVIPSWFLSPVFSLIKKDFAQAVVPFRILLLSVPFFFMTSFLQWILIAKKKQTFLMWVYFFSAVLNIVLNLVFIPIGSYIASAWITCVSEVAVFFLLLRKTYTLHYHEDN